MEGAAVFTLEESFEELTEQAIAKPSDEAIFDALRMHLIRVRESGQVEQLMQMSMVLGAMACLHPHLEDIANESSELSGLMGKRDEHGHDHDNHKEHDTAHDARKCANCKVGRQCRRR